MRSRSYKAMACQGLYYITALHLYLTRIPLFESHFKDWLPRYLAKLADHWNVYVPVFTKQH